MAKPHSLLGHQIDNCVKIYLMNCPECENLLTKTHKGEFCLSCGYAKLKRQTKPAAKASVAKKTRLKK